MKKLKMFIPSKKNLERRNKVAEKNIKILKSGKLKVKKGTKIDLDNYIKSDGLICSRIEGILNTDEEIVIDESTVKPPKIEFAISDLGNVGKLLSISEPETSTKEYTVIQILNKKSALNVFDFMNDDIVGHLLRTSTLAAIYKKFAKQKWTEINDEDFTKFFNALFVPKIFTFLNDKNGKMLKHPYKICLLIVSHPEQDDMSGDIEGTDDTKAIRLIIENTVDAVIRCGIKNLIINPLGNKILRKDKDLTMEIWKDVLNQEKSIENIDSVYFALSNESDYVFASTTFNKEA